MSSNVNKDLVEAYNQICLNGSENLHKEYDEFVTSLTEQMISEGYEVTKEEVEKFCLDEGIPGWGTIKAFVSGAEQGMQATARRQAAAERLRQRLANRQAAANAQRMANVQKAGDTAGRVLTTLKPTKKSTTAGLAIGTGEFALSGQATGDGKSIMANIPGAVVGGIGQAIQGASGATLTKLGYPGPEKIGTEMRRLGNWMSGQAHTPTPGQTQPLPRQVRTERNPYGLQRQPQNSSVDLFDLVKGHLLDEGYASTEDQAVVIMANMGEKWKQEILEKVSEN